MHMVRGKESGTPSGCRHLPARFSVLVRYDLNPGLLLLILRIRENTERRRLKERQGMLSVSQGAAYEAERLVCFVPQSIRHVRQNTLPPLATWLMRTFEWQQDAVKGVPELRLYNQINQQMSFGTMNTTQSEPQPSSVGP